MPEKDSHENRKKWLCTGFSIEWWYVGYVILHLSPNNTLSATVNANKKASGCTVAQRNQWITLETRRQRRSRKAKKNCSPTTAYDVCLNQPLHFVIYMYLQVIEA